MNNKDNKELAIDNKRLYYLLLTLPFILIIGLIVSIYYVPAIQTIFLSFFDQCKTIDIQSGFNLFGLGTIMIILMMPIAFFEFAIGFACTDYLTPIIIITLAKIIGESSSFFLGKYLSLFLNPLLQEFKFFNAIEKLTKRKPYKTQFLMRMSGVTPQLIMNYGMGVIGNVSFFSFAIVQTIVGLPSTILAVFIGKQFHKIKDIFNTTHQTQNSDVVYVELGIIMFGALSIGCLLYYVVKEYTKILQEQESLIVNKETLDDELDKTCDDIELSHAI